VVSARDFWDTSVIESLSIPCFATAKADAFPIPKYKLVLVYLTLIKSGNFETDRYVPEAAPVMKAVPLRKDAIRQFDPVNYGLLLLDFVFGISSLNQ
jgi:hypothetical protein